MTKFEYWAKKAFFQKNKERVHSKLKYSRNPSSLFPSVYTFLVLTYLFMYSVCIAPVRLCNVVLQKPHAFSLLTSQDNFSIEIMNKLRKVQCWAKKISYNKISYKNFNV